MIKDILDFVKKYLKFYLKNDYQIKHKIFFDEINRKVGNSIFIKIL